MWQNQLQAGNPVAIKAACNNTSITPSTVGSIRRRKRDIERSKHRSG